MIFERKWKDISIAVLYDVFDSKLYGLFEVDSLGQQFPQNLT